MDALKDLPAREGGGRSLWRQVERDRELAERAGEYKFRLEDDVDTGGLTDGFKDLGLDYGEVQSVTRDREDRNRWTVITERENPNEHMRHLRPRVTHNLTLRFDDGKNRLTVSEDSAEGERVLAEFNANQGLDSGVVKVWGMPSHSIKNPAVEGEFHQTLIGNRVEVGGAEAEGREWMRRFELGGELTDEGVGWRRIFEEGGICDIPREDRPQLETPIKGHPYADRVLFMLSPAGEEHVFARGVGSGSPGYRSHILHGRRVEDGINWNKLPLIDDDKSREDVRTTMFEGKTYLTYTLLPDPKKTDRLGVGLTVVDDLESPFESRRELGTIMEVNEYGVDAKDAALFPERINGKVGLLVRFKPGIQAVTFDSIDDVINLTRMSSEEKNRFWMRIREDYNRNPRKYNHLHPYMPEMRLWEARNKPVFDARLRDLLKHYQDSDFYDIDLDGPHWYGTGPAPLPVEWEGRKYWLGFHHRGQVIGELTKEGEKKRTMDRERPDSLKFYCVLATLHARDDPTKLEAIYPTALSMPSSERYRERGKRKGVKDPLLSPDAVPFVFITAGAALEERPAGVEVRHGREGMIVDPEEARQGVASDTVEKVLVPVGVNDVYTVVKWFTLEKLMHALTKYGRVDKA